ncbi:hypothetical protein HPB51_018922 [Rhipicephalus microplus]|uniref:CCHC-type domain-containing protein n=1 Tax=Rhipicephalus microplus TaxID=6941 RepID=A0A9J6DPG9_RHIMP|nr:hypothetical protein HPB51_018922 [Rhipicephalus microplus]
MPPITVHVDGIPIPQVSRARILGLHVQADGRSNYTVFLLSRQTERIVAVIRRVSNRHSGLREEDLLRLVEACIISRLTYHLPFQRLTQAQLIPVDALIRKATKLAHGLPHYTSTYRLLNLGTHNTIGELLEAHWVSHRQRLLLTRTGRYLLARLGHSVPPLEPEAHPTTLSPALRKCYDKSISVPEKQIDFCKECGRLGHKPDVCPRLDIKLCPNCGLKNTINGPSVRPSAEYVVRRTPRLRGSARPNTRCRTYGSREGGRPVSETCKSETRHHRIAMLVRWKEAALVTRDP